MTSARPGRLRLGDRVRFEKRTYTVVGLTGMRVRLADTHGTGMLVDQVHLQAAEDFAVIGAGERAALGSAALLGQLPEDVAERALWWQRHLVELLTGLPPDAPEGTRPRPEYDPVGRRSLAERERAKAAELVALGEEITARTVKRKRQRYEAGGVQAVVDHRLAPHASLLGRADPRVVEAIRRAIAESVPASTRTIEYARWRTERILIAEHGGDAVRMPSRATFYRLFDKLSHGVHVTGSARTRRSLADRPEGPFRFEQVVAPGELMQIDSTPMDVLVRLDEGVPGRVELCGLVDVATRTMAAAVVRPTTKSVDASLLLARALTPEPMRPGWAKALAMSRSVLPHRRLLTLDERLEHAAARPVIIPETIVCDRGKAFISENFRSACRTLEINFQPCHPRSPTEKPHIERTIESVATLFCQFLPGYLGRTAEHRGRNVEDEPLWSMLEIQELLDEWLVAKWQNRPHDGLRDPGSPGRMFTPNQKYTSLVETAGYVPLALSGDDYVELLPATWRAVNAYGIKINNRIYDCPDLAPFRRQPSGVTRTRNLWETHRDPYDANRLWMRNHWNPETDWIPVPWTHLGSVPQPFGDLAWDHAAADLRRTGNPSPTEEQIATAVAELLVRADEGPAREGDVTSRSAKRNRRVAARTRAAAQSTGPRPPRPEPGSAAATTDSAPEAAEAAEDRDTRPIAKVIPLGVFDPFKEADKRW
ncbi:integrase [Embleya scabrispora]|uniref:Integrase n=1 Tax=Embleya scabrispora TaxID=159449 RepID=A0A1T3NJA4_9ACTN|nr:DDE-type integrase/transposase/recombinase [Embleya scabrispora]OPC76775.1 integrase [Embleya scabrispora]